MGGKKKTKWRKLPLEEFTKECPNSLQLTKQDNNTSPIRKEQAEPPVLTYEETTENANQCNNEYGDFADAMVYPTSYVVYNPVEVPMYPNYVMPSESCCYYYLPPEMMPVQDYTTMPYQDYVPPMKDTVYLLLPAPALRTSHGLPPVTYDWRNRRRRRRYEGYAEYAVIPEKATPSGQREEKDKFQKSYQNVSISNAANQNKNMASLSESSSLTKEKLKSNPVTSEKLFSPSEEQGIGKKNSIVSNNEENNKQQEYQKSKRRKSKEICGVHSTRSPEKINQKTNTESQSQRINKSRSEADASCATEWKGSPKSIGIQNGSEITKCVNMTSQTNYPEKTIDASEAEICDRKNGSQQMPPNTTQHSQSSSRNDAKEKEQKDSLDMVQESTLVATLSEATVLDQPTRTSSLHNNKEMIKLDSSQEQSSILPDILRTVQTVHKYAPAVDTTDKDTPFDINKSTVQNNSITRPKAIFSQPSYKPHSFSADSFHQDSEVELKHLESLQPLKANQSIYKLAFDENITDQSEADSRSPSPIDPEAQVPRSLTNAEILIHEADSTSEAGSEDVELIPHRYESETFLHENKHVYMNKLSLAVELLRTQENLPYDDQFKRVVNEDTKVAVLNTKGEVNFGFVEDSSPFVEEASRQSLRILDTTKTPINAAPQSSQHLSRIIRNDIEDICNDSCEEAREVVETSNNQDNTEEVRAGYRRFQVQFRHYFTPRAALVNPCLCCTIM